MKAPNYFFSFDSFLVGLIVLAYTLPSVLNGPRIFLFLFFCLFIFNLWICSSLCDSYRDFWFDRLCDYHKRRLYFEWNVNCYHGVCFFFIFFYFEALRVMFFLAFRFWSIFWWALFLFLFYPLLYDSPGVYNIIFSLLGWCFYFLVTPPFFFFFYLFLPGIMLFMGLLMFDISRIVHHQFDIEEDYSVIAGAM